MDSRTKKTNNKRLSDIRRSRDVFNECVKVYAVSEGCKGML